MRISADGCGSKDASHAAPASAFLSAALKSAFMLEHISAHLITFLTASLFSVNAENLGLQVKAVHVRIKKRNLEGNVAKSGSKHKTSRSQIR